MPESQSICELDELKAAVVAYLEALDALPGTPAEHEQDARLERLYVLTGTPDPLANWKPGYGSAE